MLNRLLLIEIYILLLIEIYILLIDKFQLIFIVYLLNLTILVIYQLVDKNMILYI